MQQRPVWKVIVFGLITLGIYDIYWLYKTRLELVAKGYKIPRVIVLFSPFALLILAGIISYLAHAFTNPDLQTGTISPVMSAVNILTIILGVIATIGFIVIPLIWFYRYSQAVDGVTYGSTSFTLSYLMFIVLAFVGVLIIWPGIIQDGFNNIDEALGRPGNRPDGTPETVYQNHQINQAPAENPAPSPVPPTDTYQAPPQPEAPANWPPQNNQQ